SAGSLPRVIGGLQVLQPRQCGCRGNPLWNSYSTSIHEFLHPSVWWICETWSQSPCLLPLALTELGGLARIYPQGGEILRRIFFFWLLAGHGRIPHSEGSDHVTGECVSNHTVDRRATRRPGRRRRR